MRALAKPVRLLAVAILGSSCQASTEVSVPPAPATTAAADTATPRPLAESEPDPTQPPIVTPESEIDPDLVRAVIDDQPRVAAMRDTLVDALPAIIADLASTSAG